MAINYFNTFTEEELAAEEWRPVVGWEDWYSVSNLGIVRREKGRTAGRILKPSMQKTGYLVIGLTREGIQNRYLIHRLVMIAFTGNNHLDVNHKDRNQTNNKLSNLEWATPSENNHHRFSISKPNYILNLEHYPIENVNTIEPNYFTVFAQEEMNSEVWKPITTPGFEDYYSVSNLGRVRREKTISNTISGYILQPRKNTQTGYLSINLRRTGFKNKLATIHRLVALAFYGNSELVTNHIDNDRTNNRLSNLQLCTQKENVSHAIRSGRMLSTGENNCSRTHPESVPRGDDHWTRRKPELLARGSNHGHSKLTEADIRLIKTMLEYKIDLSRIGKRFNVHIETIRKIKLGTRWKHVL